MDPCPCRILVVSCVGAGAQDAEAIFNNLTSNFEENPAPAIKKTVNLVVRIRLLAHSLRASSEDKSHVYHHARMSPVKLTSPELTHAPSSKLQAPSSKSFP